MATRYFRATSGVYSTTWNSTQSWSDTSGGTRGASIPTSVDDVIIDSNSIPGGAYLSQTEVVIDIAGAVCNTLTVTGTVQLRLTFTTSSARLNVTAGVTISVGTAGDALIDSAYVSNAMLIAGGTITHTSGRLGVGCIISALKYSAPSNTTARILAGGGLMILTDSATSTVWSIVVGSGGHTNESVLDVRLTGIVASGSTRTITNGGTNAAYINFDIRGGTAGGIVTFTASTTVGDVIFYNTFAGTWATTSFNIGGSLDIVGNSVAFAMTGTGTITFVGTGTFSSKSYYVIPGPIVITSPASITLSGAVVTSNTITLTSGTLALASYTLTCLSFASSNTNTRTLNFGTGKIVLTNAATSTIWNTSTVTGLTVSGTTNTVEILAAGTTVRTINTGALSEANSISFSNLLTAAGTVAFTSGNTVRNLIINTASGILSNIAITIYGSVTTTAGTLTAGTNAWTFASTSGTDTLSSNGLTWDFPITFSGTGGTWQLASNITVGASRVTTHTAGTLNFNDFVLQTGTFSSSNSNVRTLAFGTSGRVDFSSTTATTTLLTLTTTNLTITGTPAMGVVGAGTQARAITNGAAVSEATAWDFVVNTTGGSTTVPTYTRTLTVVAGSVANSTLSIYGGFIWTTGSITSSAINFIATSGTWPLTFTGLTENLIFNGVGGTWQPTANCSTAAANTTTLTNGTLSLNNFVFETGTFASSNSNVRTIDFGATGRIDLSSTTATTTLLDLTTTTNLNTTGTPTIGTVGAGTQSRVITNGAAVSEATAWDFRVNTTGGSTTVPTYTRTLTHIAGTVANSTLSIYGGYIWTAGTVSSAAINFIATSGSWPLTFTSLTETLIFNGVGGTWYLTANCSTAAAYTTTLTNGTLNLAGFVLETGTFASSNSNVRTIDFGATGRIDFNSTTIATTLLDLTVTTNLTIAGTPAIGTVGAGPGGPQSRVITNGAAVSEATAWDFRVNTTGGSTTLPTYTRTLTVIQGTVSGTANLYGGISYTAGTLPTTINFVATSGTWPLSGTLPTDIVFNGPDTIWQLTANFSTSNTNSVTLTAGTIDLNEFVLETGIFASSNSNVRTIDFGAVGRIDLSNTTVTTTLLDLTTTTNLTVVGTPTIGTVGAGAQSRLVTNGYAVSESTAWNFRINTTDGSTSIPTYTRTLTQVAGNIANTTLNLYGGLIWTAGTLSPSGNPVNFVATSGTWPLSFTGVPGDLVFNGAGGTWQLSGTASVGAGKSVTVSQGTLSLSTFVLTTPAIVMDGGTIAFGTSNIVVNGTSGTPVNITGGSTTGTPVINVTYAGIAGGLRSLTCAVPIQINVTVGADAIRLVTQVHSVAFTGTFTGSLANAAVSITGNLTFKTGMTIGGGSNAVSFIGTSGTQVITPAALTLDFPIIVNTSGSTVQLAAATTMGTTRSMTLTAGTLNLNNFALSVGTFNSSNTNARTLAFGTSGSITLSAATSTTIWDTSTNTNLSITGTTSVTAANAAGAKTITNGSVAEASAINWSILTPASVTLSGAVKNLTLNNASLVLDAVDLTVYGNFTTTALSSFATDATPITFAATSGTQTFTTNAKTVNQPIVINSTSTVTLGGALTSSSTLSLLDGIFNAATYSVTVDKFDSSNTTTRTLQMGSGTWTLTGVDTVWDTSTTTNLTFTKGTAALALSNTTTSARTFAGGGLSYNGISIGGTTGISTTTFTGSNTFTTFASTKTVAHTIEFEPSTTTTITTWSVTGTSGNVVTLGVSGGSGTFNLTASAATAFQINFMSISNCNASPSSTTWYASRSTDGGNNTGINFNARPLYWRGGTGTWDASTSTNWSYTSGGSSAGVAPVVDCDVIFDGSSDSNASFTVTVSTGATCRNFTANPVTYTMTLAGTAAWTISGSLTLPATLFTRTYTGQIIFGTLSSTDSATRTITLNGQTLASTVIFGSGSASDTATWVLGGAFATTAAAGVTLTRGVLDLSSYTLTTPIFASSNSNNRTINFGTGKIVLTAAVLSTIWDVGASTNFAVSGTPLVEVTSVGATTKTINTGQVAEAQAISFSILGGVSTGTISITGTAGLGFKNLTVNTVSAVNFPAIGINIYGNLQLGTGMTSVNFNSCTLTFAASSGTQTIDFSPSPPTVNANIEINNNVQLLNNLTLSNNGTMSIIKSFDANNRNVKVGAVAISGYYYPTITMGSGTWELTGVGTVWGIFGNGGSTTLNSGTSTILLSNNSTSARTFVGGVGYVYNNLVIGGTTSSSTLTISSNATFNTFSSIKTVAHTILFVGGSTNTFTSFTVTGTAGNVVTIGSTDSNQVTLSKPTVWYVGSNSSDGGNNSNLIFSGGNNLDYLNLSNVNGDPPVPASSGFFMFCT